jgi:cytochrome c peroxidase
MPHNTGVPGNPEIWTNPERRITFVTYANFMGIENYMNLRVDPGAHIRDHRKDSNHTSITPTLAFTAPCMRNSIIETLAEVVAFYTEGGGADTDTPQTVLGAPPVPLDNPQTDAKVALGGMLYCDPRPGGNPSAPCSTIAQL